ncbi:MAG: DUF2085 domain-containing protein [Acidobacteriota bacterium]
MGSTRLGLVVAGSLGWVAAVLLAPLLPGGAVPAAVYLVGGLVCHQQADRSFHLDGAQVAVCARCLGLYAGGAIGTVLWSLVRRRARWPGLGVRGPLAVLAAPTIGSVALGTLGWWDAGNVARAGLAVPLGVAAGVLVAAAAVGDLR